jgi:hypothetical protein
MPNWISKYDLSIGALEAFIVALGVVALDCYNNVKAALRHVTVPLYTVLASWVVWTLCGLFAVGAFVYSANASSDNWISQALSLGATNNFVRGLTVGGSVLLLIRSKVMSVANSEVGLEFIYNLGRTWILKSYNNKRVIDKNRFLTDKIGSLMAKQNYERGLIQFVKDLMAADPEATRKAVDDQFSQVQTTRPAAPFDAANADWKQYYTDLAGIAVDYCGVKPIAQWAG